MRRFFYVVWGVYRILEKRVGRYRLPRAVPFRGYVASSTGKFLKLTYFEMGFPAS